LEYPHWFGREWGYAYFKLNDVKGTVEDALPVFHGNEYNISMEVEWDPNKASINLQKHGVNFADAQPPKFDKNTPVCGFGFAQPPKVERSSLRSFSARRKPG
jgi:hypothetical protein